MGFFQFGALALFYMGAFIKESKIPSIKSWSLADDDDRRVVFKVSMGLIEAVF